MVAAEAQPQPGACMTPNTVRPNPGRGEHQPAPVDRRVRGSRETGTRHAARAATTAATGTKTTKTLPHRNRSISHPAAIGPSAIPAPALASHAPMAVGRPLPSEGLAVGGIRLPLVADGPQPVDAAPLAT